jgi:DNA-binding FadR family transcriptional regulator
MLRAMKAVKKKRAYEDIVQQIRSVIEKGKLNRGDQLPNEKDLSETFHVSRSTVREAILSLETMQLVDRRQGDGTYVIASSEEAFIRPLATALFQEKDDIIDIFALRKIIEPEVPRNMQLRKRLPCWRQSSTGRRISWQRGEPLSVVTRISIRHWPR